tara:strand:- start:316 stop:669 length:354 start_codon:yes stop_codon:yes gene_type:complete
MSTKEQLIEMIKKWIENDNEIKLLQDAIKKKKDEKKQATDKLLEVMKDNEIDCFDIKNGKLLYSQRKTKKAVTKKTLFETLNKYFNDDEDKANDITQYILDSREEKIVETIRRKKTN